jgi:hypothetical protein
VALVNKDMTMIWSIAPQEGDVRIQFSHPADHPSNIIRVYHGVNNNVPNRIIGKTILRGRSAGGFLNVRNVGFEEEHIRLEVVLSTYQEARDFTDFFKNTVRGSSEVFLYENLFTGQSAIVRLAENGLSIGQNVGHPHSFNLLMRIETPYSGSSLTMPYDIIEAPPVTAPLLSVNGQGDLYNIILPSTASRIIKGSGQNSSGQLGLGDKVNRDVFTQAGSATDWAQISCGDGHSMVLNESGEIWSCGENGDGQLGQGDKTDRETHEKMGADTWLMVAAGHSHSAGIKSDGTMWAWGKNNNGQLGQGFTGSDITSPVQVGSATNWVYVACSGFWTVAKNSLGELWGWGNDNSGQLGQGSQTTSRTLPVQIGADNDWDFFGLGWEHTLAVKNNGLLYVCGNNSAGQLGLGDVTLRTTLTQQSFDTWKAVVGSPSDASYAIKTAGTLWSWGRNFSTRYALGTGSPLSDPNPDPILIHSDPYFISVASGSYHGLATTSNGDLYGWGWNVFGALGFGHENAVTTPTLITL